MALESLEQRMLLASDVLSVANVFWRGEQVTARADAWVVTTDSPSAAPAVPAGWTRSSLGGGYFVVRAPGSSASGMASWASAAGVRSIEPDRIITTAQVANDPSFGALWGLDNTGQTGGVSDADIDAPEAWDITTGSRAAVVAVIDTGIDYRHQDLAENMWRNPGEIAGDGIDNDGNGFVDDVYGWDFANNDADPFDDNGHGTHVAGTIGAVGNNGVGVTGVNWQVSLMALKFMSASGSGTSSAAIAAINYATMMRRTYGINVVATSNSWGGGGVSTTMHNAIVEGGNAGILFVAAAGNSASNNDARPTYPASYASDAVITVAATDSSNRLASFSNYGATSVDIGAPGVGIYSTVPNGGYASYSGTSMATPHVAGAVALMAAANPQATATQIRDALFATAVPTASLAGKVATGGLLNVAAAVAAIRGRAPDPGNPAAPGSLAARATSSTQVELTWTDNSTNETSFRIERRSGSAGSWSEIATVGSNVTRFTNTGLTAGTTYTYRVRASAGMATSAYSNESSVTTPVVVVANDGFANATVISGTTLTATGTNVGATKESGEPNHAGRSGGKSVWWVWTAPASGSVRISTAGSTFDTILGVYTGSSVSSLTHIASDDDGGSNYTSLVNFTAVEGTTYRIAVDGYGAASGSISLNVAVTVAQLGRSTSAATANASAVRVDSTSQSRGSSQATILHAAVASIAASPVSTTGGESKPRRLTN